MSLRPDDPLPCSIMAQEWVGQVEAVSITLVRGLELQQVGDILQFDWGTQHEASFFEAEAEDDFDRGDHPVQVEAISSTRGDWLALVEPNGYLASLPENLERLSDSDVALSVFWNVNAQMRFTFFAEGQLIRDFNPLLPDLVSRGNPLKEEVVLDFGLGAPRENALRLLESLTGCSFGTEWLLATRRTTWTARWPYIA